MDKSGYFGIGVYHPKNAVNIGTLWRSAVLLGASYIFTIGRRYRNQASDTLHAPSRLPLYTYTTFAAFYAALPHGCRLVCVEMADDAVALPALTHPDRAVYLLGAEDHGLPRAILDGHQLVVIPSLSPTSYNVAVAGSLVMYDRLIKQTEAGR